MLDWNTVGIVVTIIVVAASATAAILKGFRNLERSFYKALAIHKDEDNDKFEGHALRLQRLELSEFGFDNSKS